MGRRRKSNPSSKARKAAEDNRKGVLSDYEDDEITDADAVSNEVDRFYEEDEEDLLDEASHLITRRRSGAAADVHMDQEEVFGLSGYSSESDAEAEDVGDHEFVPNEVAGSWGHNKRAYYGGSLKDSKRLSKKSATADNDQDFDEAEAEEKEGRFLQSKQLAQLTDDDFFGESFAPQRSKSELKENEDVEDTIPVNLAKLSKQEKRQLFLRGSPEFPVIMKDFSLKMDEVIEKLLPMCQRMEVGKATVEGPVADYIRLRMQVMLNYCTNIACYVMFKTKKVDLKSHGITLRLIQYKNLLDDIESSLDSRLSLDRISDFLQTPAPDQPQLDKAAKPQSGSKKRKTTLKVTQQASMAQRPALDEDLTPDEQLAVEMHQQAASRKRHRVKDDSDDDQGENEDPEDEGDEMVDSRRGITYEMSKNKGLRPKRSKLQRNPRVKHRKKFEKAKIRRKGQIREVRTENKKYIGELSGINKRVKKGIKLN